MDVTLPSGVVINGVPDGTSKEEIKRKAIAAGLATEQDFAMPSQPQAPAANEPQQSDSWLSKTPHAAFLRGIGNSLRSVGDAYSALFAGENPLPHMQNVVLNSPRGVAGETALTMGSGVVGQVAGGLSGIPAALAGGSDAGAAVSQDVAESLTYQPRGAAADALAPVGEAMQAVQNVTGEGAVEVI